MIKILLIKYFLGEVYKLKGFLIQIKIKIINKGLRLPIAIKKGSLYRTIFNKKGIKIV